MKKIDSSLVDFLTTVTTDFMGLIGKIEQMKDNMAQLKKESEISKSDLAKARIASNARGPQAIFNPSINDANEITEEKNDN